MSNLSTKLPWDLANTKWAAQLNPLLSNQLMQGQLITGIKLINGVTTFNHLLSRQMIGWMLVDIDAAATVFRSQPLNDKTLTLNSNAAATVAVWCF